MHDVGVTVDPHQGGHRHGAGSSHASDVVARQVHKHDVFGALLRVRLQLFGQCSVCVRVGAAFAGARDGVGVNCAVLDLDQHFR